MKTMPSLNTHPQMRVLVVDRDEISLTLLQGYLKEKEVDAVIEHDRNQVFERDDLDGFDLLLLDLSTMSSPIKYVVDLKSRFSSIPYIVLMAKEGDEKAALRAGANGLLEKPISKQDLFVLLEQVGDFADLVRSLGDPENQYPYHKGIISNMAMNELFLSSLDRTTRYTEDCSLLVFSLKNAEQIAEDYGPEIEEQASQWMSNHVIRLRRQSDLMARTGQNQYMILIQRPLFKEEPLEAARRFVTGFLRHPGADIPEFEGQKITLDVNVRVLELPGARKAFEETVVKPNS